MVDDDKIFREIIEHEKGHWFIQHIQKHLSEKNINGKVICKICNKDVDTIANERLREIVKEAEILKEVYDKDKLASQNKK